jgi:hypothetical protein
MNSFRPFIDLEPSYFTAGSNQSIIILKTFWYPTPFPPSPIFFSKHRILKAE